MYTIQRNASFLRESRPSYSNSLAELFQDSQTLFQVRLRKLANIKKETTDEDTAILRVMLEALIHAKKTLQKP